MTDKPGAPGSIPRRGRRLMIVTCVVVFVLVTGGCLLINAFADSPVDWFWLVAAGVFVTALTAVWFWVRLSN